MLLTQRDVARLADMPMAIRSAREAFKAMARGQTVMPPKLYLPLPGGNDFRAMPAFLRRPAACGVKWVNVHLNNHRLGLPTVMAVIVLNDPATGVPLAVMDGLLITKLRTAASAAVAAKTLARPDSRVVGLIGCGAQADAQIEALAELFHPPSPQVGRVLLRSRADKATAKQNRLERVQVWGYLPGEAQRFCRRMRRQLPRIIFEPCASIKRCVGAADIVVTITPSRRPLIKREWLAPGAHINAIGADAPGKQELDPRILKDALVVVDDRAQAIHGGELNVPIRRRQFHPRQIHATLGEILLGRRRGRRDAHELTVFDCTGLAIHDVALAASIVHHARLHHIGRRVSLFA